MNSEDTAINLILFMFYVFWPAVILGSLYFARKQKNHESNTLLLKAINAWVVMLATTIFAVKSIAFENFTLAILSFAIFMIAMAYSILGVVSLLPNDLKKHNKII